MSSKMILHPFDKISGVDTGNPYKGFVDIAKGEKFIDVARDFHGHSVFVKSSKFPNSSIMKESIHVYYNKNGEVIGVEVFLRDSDGNRTNFSWGDIDLLPDTMQIVANEIRERNMNFAYNDYGIDVPDLGLSYFCSDFENDLHCRIDCVYVTLARERNN
ncbi:hypothetical protein [Sinorhizobium arboris]|uniref:hypothetical protein n=1 Tax=Sinorhizobium arboris TaxID=76745 RepID=UPI0012433C03|nr:hypothetical protein [Sinorhizobium arboris]